MITIYNQEQLAAILEHEFERQEPPHGMPECAECGDGCPRHIMVGILCPDCAEEES